MEDDDYELISKKHLAQLKEENEKLKKSLKGGEEEKVDKKDNNSLKSQDESSNSKNDKGVDSIVAEVVEVMQEESKKERELILENLNEIKDLNKSTLDNLLEKTQSLDERLEGMVSTISGLVETLSSLVDSLTEFKSHNSENYGSSKGLSNSGVEEIKKLILDLESKMGVGSTNSDSKDSDLMEKLLEIEVFMKNLRVLLSYVKPANLVLDNATQSNSLNSNNSNNSSNFSNYQN